MHAPGPAYIKLGQALSIRPDILSPAAMNELQKLCDKVPSFNNDVAMQVIRDELGAPWHEVCLLRPGPPDNRSLLDHRSRLLRELVTQVSSAFCYTALKLR